VRADDDAQLEAFLAHAGQRLLTLAWLLCGDPGLARQWSRRVLEEVAARWGHRSLGDPVAYGRSALVSLHTRHERHRAHPAGPPEASPQPPRPTVSDGDPEHAVLLWALAQLTARERQAVVLERAEGLSCPSTAQAMRTRQAVVRRAGSEGWARLRGLVSPDGRPAPEDDVAGLVERAVTAGPRMHVDTDALLDDARSRRRRDRWRRGGWAVAVTATVALVAWVVPWGQGDEPVTARDRVAWDATADFEVDVVTGLGVPWPELGAARLVRPAGDEDFTLVVDPEGAATEVPSAGSADLPEGMDLFPVDGNTVLVSEGLYEAPAELDLTPWSPRLLEGAGENAATDDDDNDTDEAGVELSDGTGSVRVWVVDGRLRPDQIAGVRWLLSDEVVASSGDRVGGGDQRANTGPPDAGGRHAAVFLAVGQDNDYACATGGDGCAAAIAPLPADPRGYGPEPDIDSVHAQLVFDVDGELVTGEQLALVPGVTVRVPRRPELVQVYLPQRSVPSDGVDLLPTLLFETDLGPRWAGRPPPGRYETEAGETLTVSLDDDLGVWAAGCGSSIPALGIVGATVPRYLECTDRSEGTSPTRRYAVLVLPPALAAKAAPVRPGDVDVGTPTTVRLGQGLSLWVLPWSGEEDGPTETVPGRAPEVPFGVDPDGDGRSDDEP